jgi:hypothetical protein
LQLYAGRDVLKLQQTAHDQANANRLVHRLAVHGCERIGTRRWPLPLLSTSALVCR